MVDLKLVFIFAIIPFLVCEELPIPDVGKYPPSFLKNGQRGGLGLLFNRTEKAVGRSIQVSSLSGEYPSSFVKSEGLSGLFNTTEKAVDYARGISPLFGQYPWQAVLAYLRIDLNKHSYRICAGTLISKSFVLTAAHCVKGIQKDQVSVTLGEYNLEEDEGPEIIPEIKQIIIHPHWKAAAIATNNPDIALIEFETPVQLTDHIQIASLPTGPPEIDEAVTAAGWGITQGNIAPDKIKGALLKIISRADCERRVEHKRSNQVAKGNLCAISRTNYDGHATCEGDSGGKYETSSF